MKWIKYTLTHLPLSEEMLWVLTTLYFIFILDAVHLLCVLKIQQV